MKPSALTACVLCLTSLSVSGPAMAQAPSMDSQLEVIRTEYGLPALAAAVVKNGEIVAKGAVGTRVLGTDNPVTIDDRFHLGSDAKAMTATLVGMMVDEGKFKWTTTVGEVLGPDMPVSTRRLLPSRSSNFCRIRAAFPRTTRRWRNSMRARMDTTIR